MEVAEYEILDSIAGAQCIGSSDRMALFTIDETLFIWPAGSNPVQVQLPFAPATMCVGDGRIALACSDSILFMHVTEDGAAVIDTSIPPGDAALFPLITHSAFNPQGTAVAICSKGMVFVVDVNTMIVSVVDCGSDFGDCTMACFGASTLFVVSRTNRILAWNVSEPVDGQYRFSLKADGGIICSASSVTSLAVDDRSGSLIVGQSDGLLKYLSMKSKAGSYLAQEAVVDISKELAVPDDGDGVQHGVECVIQDIVMATALNAIVTTPLGILTLHRDARQCKLVVPFEEVCGASIASKTGTVLTMSSFSSTAGLYVLRSSGHNIMSQTQEAELEENWINASQPLPPALMEPLELEKKAADPKARPVTFGKPIKSSGYSSSTPWSVQQANKEKAKAKAKLATQKKKAPSVATTRNYDVTQGPSTQPLQKANTVMKGPLHNGAITAMRFDATGNLLATASTDATAHLLKCPVAKNNGEGISVRGHKSMVSDVDVNLSLNHPTIATGSFDGILGIWRPTKKETPYILKAVEGGKEIRAVRFMYMDRLLGVASGSSIQLHKCVLDEGGGDLDRKRNDSKTQLCGQIQGEGQQITSFDCFNAVLSTLVVYGMSNKAIGIHDIAAERAVRVFDDAHARAIHSIEMHTSTRYAETSADSLHTFLSAGMDKCVRMWDVRMEDPVRVFGSHNNSSVPVGVTFSPCSKYVVVGSEDRSFYTYDRASGEVIERTMMPDTVSSLRFNPTQPTLVAGANNGVVRFFGP